MISWYIARDQDLDPETVGAFRAQVITGVLLHALKHTRTRSLRDARKRFGTGRRKKNCGYVRIHVGTDHPMSASTGWIREHRYVMAKHLGMAVLPREWSVHHKRISEGGSGRKDDNRIENLVCFSSQRLHQRWEHLLTQREELSANVLDKTLDREYTRLT